MTPQNIVAAPLGSDPLVITNSAPTVAEVRLSPAEATRSDPITCLATGSDPDGDAVVIEVSWYVDDQLVAASGPELRSVHERGQSVRCEAVARDDVARSAPLASPTLVVGNASPVLTSASISPSAPTAASLLTCDYEGSDADGDVLSASIRWLVGGTEVGTGPTLAGAFARGLSVGCVVSLGDGLAQTAEVTSALVVIENSLPTASLTMTPEAPSSADEIRCEAVTADADGDAVSVRYQWVSEGLVVADDTAVYPGSAPEGLELACSVVLDDGAGGTTRVTTATAEVGNGAPSITALDIVAVPQSENFRCDVVATDPDGDPISISYTWTFDGVEVGNADVVSGPFAVEGALRCTATPSDGGGFGAEATDEIIAGNAPPEVRNTQFVHDAMRRELVCAVNALDPEGDAIATTTELRRNGVLLPGSDPSFFAGWYGDVAPAPGLARGDVIDCVVRLDDGGPRPLVHTFEPLVIDNGLPSPPQLTLSMGTTSEPVRCNATSTDPDGDAIVMTYDKGVRHPSYPNPPIAYIYRAIDGAEVLDFTMSPGQVFTCVATPTDEFGGVGLATGTSGRVLDSPPVVEPLVMDPGSPTVEEPVDCLATANDFDNTPFTLLYEWSRNDVVDPAQVGSRYTGPRVRGDRLRCRVIADSDITYPFVPHTQSLPVSAEVTVQNSLPVLSQPTIQAPEGVFAGKPLRCLASASDADSETPSLTYQWFKNGVATEDTTFEIDSGFVWRDQMACEVTADDGIGSVTLRSGPVNVANSRPVITHAEFAPTFQAIHYGRIVTAASATFPVECDVRAYDPDGGELTFSYNWFNHNQPANRDNRFINIYGFGAFLGCIATVTDEAGATAQGNPGRVYLLNWPSQVDSIDLQPASPHGLETLVCTGEVSDFDGNFVEPGYSWAINGVPLEHTEATLSGGFSRGDVVECTVTPVSNGAVGEAVSTSVDVVNAPPAVTAVDVSSPAADVRSTFTCAPTIVEVDGDPFTATLQWRHQGLDLPGESGASLDLDAYPAGTFARGDSLSCVVNTTDGTFAADPVSTTVAIANAIPSATGAAVVPEAPTRLDTLTCSEVGFEDADQDGSQPSYEWFAEGSDTPLNVGSELSAAALSPGDRVFCRLTPGDGFDVGAPVDSALLTIGNLPPAATAAVAEAAPRAGDTVTCVPGAVDPEGDAVTFTYAWSVNGSTVPGVSTSTLSGVFVEDDQVACSVTPNDGITDGPEVTSAPVTIANTPPVVTSVVATPEGPNAGAVACEAMRCTWTASDLDGDAVSAVGFRWLRGAEVLSTQAVLDVAVDVGDVVSCEVTVSDGQGQAVAASAGLQTIDAPPRLQLAELTPRAPVLGEALRCRAVGMSSPCGGPLLAPSVRWFDDERPLGGEASEVLLTDTIAEGTNLSCELTPHSPTGGTGAPQRSASVTVGSGQYQITGADAAEGFGFAVGVPGDVDGDGLDDIIVGAPSTDGPNGQDTGRVYLVPGQFDSEDLVGNGGSFVAGTEGDWNLHQVLCAGCAAYLEPDQIWAPSGFINGFSAAPFGEALGRGVGRGTGDFDGDGRPDIVANAQFAPNADLTGYFNGRSYVVSGAQFGQVALTAAKAPGDTAATMVVGEEPRLGLSGSLEARIHRGGLAGDQSTLIGDFDGDGLDDLVFDAPEFGQPSVGAIYVVAGNPGGEVVNPGEARAAGSDRVMTIVGRGEPSIWYATDPRWGSRVSPAGDLDGDGLADLLVSSGTFLDYVWIVYGRSDFSTVYLEEGAPGVERVFVGYQRFLLDFEAGGFFVVEGRSNTGQPLIGGGDVNADGIDDVAMRTFSVDGAEVLVGFGAQSRGSVDPVAWAQGQGGYLVTGIDDSTQYEGASLAFADINGDGFDDIINGVPHTLSRDTRGSVVVIYGGRDTHQGSKEELFASLAGFEIDGAWDGAPFGRTLDTGDINGDGLADVVVSGSDHLAPGGAMVILGRDTQGVITHRGSSDDDLLEGTTGADVMVAGLGDDRMEGRGGDDAFSGGAGDDQIVVADGAFRRVDGGTGQDTLLTTGGVLLDLVALGARVRNIEAFDLTAAGADELRVSPRRISQLVPLEDQIVVRGTHEDTLTLFGEGWQLAGQLDIEGVSYQRIESGRFTVYYEQGMQSRVGPEIVTTQLVVREIAQTGDVVGTVEATDSDGQIASIALDDPTGSFAIDLSGEVTVTALAVLDFEAQSRYFVQVTVVDDDGLERQRSVEIFVVDVDEPPVFDPPEPFVSVVENPQPGTAVTSVRAVDPDGTDVTYQLGGPHAGSFEIEPQSGALTVSSTPLLDYEANPSVVLEVIATDAGGVVGTLDLVVTLEDQAENTRRFELLFSNYNGDSLFARAGRPDGPDGDVQLTLDPVRTGFVHDFTTPANGTRDLGGIATASATTQGEVEFVSETTVYTGLMDMSYPVAVDLTIPDELAPGTVATFDSTMLPLPGASLTGTAPTTLSRESMSVRNFDYSTQVCVGDVCDVAATRMDAQPALSVTRNSPNSRFSMVSQEDGTFSHGPKTRLLADANRNWNAVLDQTAAAAGQSLVHTFPFAGLRVTVRALGVYTSGQVNFIDEMEAGVDELRGIVTFEDGSEGSFVVGTPEDISVPAGADVDGDGRVDVTIRYELDFFLDNKTRLVSGLRSRMTSGEVAVYNTVTDTSTPYQPLYEDVQDGSEVRPLGDRFLLSTRPVAVGLSVDAAAP